jgi:hypothetical protein
MQSFSMLEQVIYIEPVGFKESKKRKKGKITLLLDVTTCGPVEVYRFFGGTYCLSLQGP